MGHFQEALGEITIAQRLDPLSEALELRAGWIFFRAGKHDRALQIGRELAAKSPRNFGVHELISFALFHKGEREEALREMETAVHLGAGQLELARLGRMYAQAGRKTDAERVLRQLQDEAKQNYTPAFCLVDVYEGLGDFEQANLWMDKAIKNRESVLVHLKVDADDLNRANPHFAEWLKKIGLDD